MTSVDYAERRKREIARKDAPPSILRRHDARYCRHCQQTVDPEGASPAWRWIAPVIGVVGFLIVLATFFTDPIGLVALAASLVYIAVLGPAIALARQTPTCPICKREVPYHSAEEAAVSERHEPPHDARHAPL